MGFQINRIELTKSFIMISNRKNPLVTMVYTQIFQSDNGNALNTVNRIIVFFYQEKHVESVQKKRIFSALIPPITLEYL